MCHRKPSQTFAFDGTPGGFTGVLLTGAGVLTDVVLTGGLDPVGTLVTLRDGVSPSGKILMQFLNGTSAIDVVATGMNLEFQDGLFLVYTPAALEAQLTIGAYIQDRSPDPMSIQLARIADELARVGAVNDKLAAFVKGLEVGNPAT